MLRKTLNAVLVLLVIAVLGGKSLLAQEPKPQSSTGTYRLDYVFSELQDNKRINARSYTLLVRAMQKGVMKTGNRIPIATGSKEAPNQIQYLDVGMNIDCRVVQELDAAVGLETLADSSSLVQENYPRNPTNDPVIRQVKYDFNSIVPLNKETLLGSVDEADGTRRMQLEVTITKIR